MRFLESVGAGQGASCPKHSCRQARFAKLRRLQEMLARVVRCRSALRQQRRGLRAAAQLGGAAKRRLTWVRAAKEDRPRSDLRAHMRVQKSPSLSSSATIVRPSLSSARSLGRHAHHPRLVGGGPPTHCH